MSLAQRARDLGQGMARSLGQVLTGSPNESGQFSAQQWGPRGQGNRDSTTRASEVAIHSDTNVCAVIPYYPSNRKGSRGLMHMDRSTWRASNPPYMLYHAPGAYLYILRLCCSAANLPPDWIGFCRGIGLCSPRSAFSIDTRQIPCPRERSTRDVNAQVPWQTTRTRHVAKGPVLLVNDRIVIAVGTSLLRRLTYVSTTRDLSSCATSSFRRVPPTNRFQTSHGDEERKKKWTTL